MIKTRLRSRRAVGQQQTTHQQPQRLLQQGLSNLAVRSNLLQRRGTAFSFSAKSGRCWQTSGTVGLPKRDMTMSLLGRYRHVVCSGEEGPPHQAYHHLGRGHDSSPRKEAPQVLRAGSGVLRGWLESQDLPRGGWVLGRHWKNSSPAASRCRSTVVKTTQNWIHGGDFNCILSTTLHCRSAPNTFLSPIWCVGRFMLSKSHSP